MNITSGNASSKFKTLHKFFLSLTGLVLTQFSSASFASDLGLNVILAGQIQPGVYGQVEIGNAPRPALVYERPRVIVVDRRYQRTEPIYLHVPPGHARDWGNHCQAYHACNRPVYFVKSVEYEPGYRRERHYDHGHHDHDDDHYHH